VKLQRKIAHASLALKTFIFSEWNFGVENFKSLNKALEGDDKYDAVVGSREMLLKLLRLERATQSIKDAEMFVLRFQGSLGFAWAVE
jgi:hypothetical protein